MWKKLSSCREFFESCDRIDTQVQHLEWDDTQEVIGASFADASLRLWNSKDGKLLHRFVLEKNVNTKNEENRGTHLRG